MSRRFKGRHAKVQADPEAKPVKPVTLDDSNSAPDPAQPDCRKPRVLNARAFVTASSVTEAAAGRAKKKAAA